MLLPTEAVPWETFQASMERWREGASLRIPWNPLRHSEEIGIMGASVEILETCQQGTPLLDTPRSRLL